MQLRASDLAGALQRGLAPVYLISGDEPLQLGECADAVRQAAARAGYSTRELMEAGTSFDWLQLEQAANSLSLFAEQRIIDLRIPSGKPGREGGAALAAYCDNPPPDTLLLISLPKLDKQQLSSKWAKAIDRIGVICQVWPIEGPQLPRWLSQRMQQLGLRAERGVAELLAEQVEGNLLAADQELRKLQLLHGDTPINAEQLTAAISDNSRFDVFDLVDSALNGNIARCVRILDGLQREGVAAPVVLWALAREIRTLTGIAYDISKGSNLNQAMAKARVWPKRQAIIQQGVKRHRYAHWQKLLRLCQRTDAAIKGVERDDPWRLLEETTLGIAGAGG